MCASPSPHQRVEPAQILAAELAFHARPAERPGHRPVELAAAAERHGTRRRAEIGHDAGEHLIAFLPVVARHVKRQCARVAPRGRPLERDVGVLGREPARLEIHLLGIEAIGQLAGDRQMPRQGNRCERPPLVERAIGARPGAGRSGESRGHRLDPGRRRDDQASAAPMFGEPAERPFQQHALAAGGAREAESLELLEVGERRQVHAREIRLEPGDRPDRGAERPNRVGEAPVAAEHLRARVGDVELGRRPMHRAVQPRKPVLVDAERRARERGRRDRGRS